MARMVFSMTTSLDGYIVDAEGDFSWAMPSDDVHQYFNDMVRDGSTFVWGRRMYETMKVWETMPTDDAQVPSVMAEFKELWLQKDKVVVSTTLDAVETTRTTLMRTFDVEALVALKASAGGDVMIGGAGIAASALQAGLVDRFEVIAMPAVVGGGTPVLPRGRRVDLRLAETRTFDNGGVLLAYDVN